MFSDPHYEIRNSSQEFPASYQVTSPITLTMSPAQSPGGSVTLE